MHLNISLEMVSVIIHPFCRERGNSQALHLSRNLMALRSSKHAQAPKPRIPNSEVLRYVCLRQLRKWLRPQLRACRSGVNTTTRNQEIRLFTMYQYGWLSKLWSFLGYPITIRYPKRHQNFDNHPYCHIVLTSNPEIC